MQANPRLKQFPNMSFLGEYLEEFLDRFTNNITRQIIRYRATATLRRPQMKQYTASNGGGGFTKVEKVEHDIILTKYEAVPPTDVSENNSLSGMLLNIESKRTK